MKKALKYTLVLIGFLSLVIIGCKDDIDPIIETLDFERVFSPTDLDVKIRDQINAEISWTTSDDANKYLAEISNDSLDFTTILITDTVMPTEIPYTITLVGEETYSVRITGISTTGLSNSKTSEIAFKTNAEQIFNSLPDSNISKKEVTLTWTAESEVTYMMITPGDVKRDLTADEIAAGQATITGLDFETEYTIILYNTGNEKQRGSVTFTTLPEAEILTADMDIEAIFSNAADGDKFLLTGGEYTQSYGTIDIPKSISIQGLSSDDMPILHVQFVIGDGASVVFDNLELNGDTLADGSADLDHAFQLNSSATSFGDISITSCKVSTYIKSFITGSSGEFEVNSIIVDDCLITDLNSDGGDFIDFRKSWFKSLSITNTTFANCDNTPRDFIRLDGSAKGNTFDDGVNAPEIAIEKCTFYNVLNSTTSTKRLLYVRWQLADEVLMIKNNIFSEMGISCISNQTDTNMPTFANNNYINAANYIDAAIAVYDGSGTALDPGFADVANYDFTLSNQTLIDNEVGDARWR